MEALYPAGGQFQGVPKLRGYRVPGLLHLGIRDAQLIQFDVVQHPGIVTHRHVAVAPHVAEHANNRLLGANALTKDLPGAVQHRLWQFAKVQGVGTGQDLLGAVNASYQLKLH